VYDLKRTYQKSVKLKTSTDANYLVDPSMIKKSIKTEEEYNTITNNTSNGESSSKDPLQQLDWLGTAIVTPLIEKGFTSACYRFRVSFYCIPPQWFPIYLPVHSSTPSVPQFEKGRLVRLIT
jgi:hypothetical protein